MKQLWLHTVRAYLRLGLFFYFKKITVANANCIPKNEAVLFLGNHQNALLDALLIATKTNRFSYFLTRASVFSNPLVRKILKNLRLLPVYRIRDGWANLTKNNTVFSQSSELLSKQEALVIFPEGSHNLKRTVRPLSKGFTRIIYETLEQYPDTKINLIPVGLNFQNATQFADSALLNFGNVIPVNHVVTKDNSSTNELKQIVFDQLCRLTTHIDTETYETTIKKLEHLNVDFTKPDLVNACIASNFETCSARTSNQFRFVKNLSKVLLIIGVFLPYLIWKNVAQPKIKEIEFTATFRFAIAITLVPIFMILVMVFLWFIVNLQIALLYALIVIVLALLSVKL